jgi:hypothetical protein
MLLNDGKRLVESEVKESYGIVLRFDIVKPPSPQRFFDILAPNANRKSLLAKEVYPVRNE